MRTLLRRSPHLTHHSRPVHLLPCRRCGALLSEIRLKEQFDHQVQLGFREGGEKGVRCGFPGSMSFSTQAKIGIIGRTLSTRWGPRQRPRHHVRGTCDQLAHRRCAQGRSNCLSTWNKQVRWGQPRAGPLTICIFIVSISAWALSFCPIFSPHFGVLSCTSLRPGSMLHFCLGHTIHVSSRGNSFSRSHLFFFVFGEWKHTHVLEVLVTVYPPLEFGTDCVHSCGYHFTRCHTVSSRSDVPPCSHVRHTHTSHSARRFVPLCAQLSSSSCIGSLLADGCLWMAACYLLASVRYSSFSGCGIRRTSNVDNVIQLGFVCHVFLLCALLTPFHPCARCLSVVCARLSTHHIYASRRRFKLCFDKKYLQTLRIDFAVLMLMPFSLLIFQVLGDSLFSASAHDFEMRRISDQRDAL